MHSSPQGLDGDSRRSQASAHGNQRRHAHRGSHHGSTPARAGDAGLRSARAALRRGRDARGGEQHQPARASARRPGARRDPPAPARADPPRPDLGLAAADPAERGGGGVRDRGRDRLHRGARLRRRRQGDSPARGAKTRRAHRPRPARGGVGSRLSALLRVRGEGGLDEFDRRGRIVALERRVVALRGGDEASAPAFA